MAVVEQKESFGKRHLIALIVGGFAVLLAVIVAGQVLDQGDVARWLDEVSEQWAYVLCLLLVWFDAVIPIFPGETTLAAASTIAAGGGLTLGLIMLAGALGAILGDSSLFWIARKSAAKMQRHRDTALENPKVRIAWESLDRSPGLLNWRCWCCLAGAIVRRSLRSSCFGTSCGSCAGRWGGRGSSRATG
jgi:L-cystine uptake protein TcyP (sodium:dicarboxylate symporter family)